MTAGDTAARALGKVCNLTVYFRLKREGTLRLPSALQIACACLV
jgi:hypothetical protein